MGTITVKDRQTMLDVALQTSGSLEALMALSIKNNRSITDELADGEELETVDVADATVVERYNVERVCPATEADRENRAAMPWGGIDFMGVEINFAVS